MSPLSQCHSLVSSLLFPLFIFPVLLCFNFISVFATHIVPLPLSCSHYFHSTAWSYTCKPLLSLYHSRSPAPFFLFFPGFVASINTLLWLVLPSLSFTLFSFSIFFKYCHISFTTYLPLLFSPFVLFLSYFVRFVITGTTSLPFPSFSFISALSNAASLMLTLQCLYHFYLSSTFYLLVPFFFYLITNILPQLMPPPPLSFCLVPPLSFIS